MTPEAFWKAFFDKDYNEALYKSHLGFPEFHQEQTETPTGLVRKAGGTPKMEVPAAVAKLMGSSFKYVEEGSFDRTSGTYKWRTIPSTMADKIKNEGVLKVEPAGEGKCRRIVEIVMEAKIFGLGGVIEGSLEKQLRDGWEKSVPFITEWVKTHG